MRLYYYSPSSDLMDEELLSVIQHGGKRYIFVERDPWVATFVRLYWYDTYLVRVLDWIAAKFKRTA